MADLTPAHPQLKPLELGELLDRTFTLYRRNFLLFVGVTAVPLLLYFAVAALGEMLLGLGMSTGGGAETGAEAVSVVGTTVAGSLLVTLTFLVAYAFAQGATVFAVAQLTLGRTANIMGALRQVSGFVLTIIGAIILVWLAVGVGFILFIVPGVLLLLATCLTVPALVVEDLGPREAITRSMNLMKGGWGRAFVIFVLMFLVNLIASFLLELPFRAAAQFAGEGVGQMVLTLFSTAGSVAGSALAMPIGAIAFGLLYFDMRVRKEAFDLQVMMSALGPGAPGSGPYTPGTPPAGYSS